MARIRSIKPEFPQSESMGNVSREARLTFIMLWTLADDEGRLRGNSRMLASLLFPYDQDAGELIDTWLGQLEKEGCIIRYKNGKDSYMQLCNWLIHQKIDKPSKSKIAPFVDPSIILANVRGGIKDQGEDQGRDQGEDKTKDAPVVAEPTKPIVVESVDVPSEQPAIDIAVALRADKFKDASFTHPTIQRWATQKVSLAIIKEAVEIARMQKGSESIPVNYLVNIVEKLVNPPPARASPAKPASKSRHSGFDKIDYNEGIEDGRIT